LPYISARAVVIGTPRTRAVLPVGRHHAIALLQNWYDADRNRLFTIVEMEKSADLFLSIKLVALFLETTDAEHLFQELQRMSP
jgi:hypothetical protein